MEKSSLAMGASALALSPPIAVPNSKALLKSRPRSSSCMSFKPSETPAVEHSSFALSSSNGARFPGVPLIRPDQDLDSRRRNYSCQLSSSSTSHFETPLLFPPGSTKHWLIRLDKPGVGVVTKAQMVDYYTQILTKVLGNEKDAQMCIYHVSWQSNFGFCCELDDECARELAEVPGVLSVQPDENFGSDNKDYGGNYVQNSLPDSRKVSPTTPIKTKKLFITGLSFYTSEKTLRAAFEGFGELVEVKIIMDKISKRSKGYAFVEYTTEEAASAALKEMNGKVDIVN
ncbi:hypothetical protein CRG98_044474 [Punica granatum]|uniref:RRM domain-containing protein n=1 Tax=Punica granatum TaxID=22663 RepID=A0A2I0HU41_PUNGR|nr:hypothetical protein CRG98_044474 [Punica granatum]